MSPTSLANYPRSVAHGIVAGKITDQGQYRTGDNYSNFACAFPNGRTRVEDQVNTSHCANGGDPLCRQVFVEPKEDRGWDTETWKSKFLEAIVWDAKNGDDLSAKEPHEIRGLPFFGAEPTRRQLFKEAFETRLLK